MCGIVAIYSPDNPIEPDVLRRATATLSHRGPDGQGRWMSADGTAGLGHCRLAIQDLSEAGAQPMGSPDGSLWMVVNGEFYDFERIRSECEAEGHRFRGRSDSEILLPLYRRFGVGALARLRGEFAFALWDAREGRLFAARDRFGIKPLYYALQGTRVLLASEIKALLAAGVPAEWDEETVRQLHLVWAHDPARTLFKHVRQVPPGHYLLAGHGGVRLARYWDFNYPVSGEGEARVMDEREQAERVGAKLREAVKLRLRADVPVACYLSGGLDSCAALGLAARERAGPIDAFTLSFDDPAYDEGGAAEEMARHAGARFHRVPVRSADFARHFEAALRQGETVIYNASVVAKYLLSDRVRAAGHKVVLTGEGADEVFAGYPHFRQDLLRERHAGDPAGLEREVAALHRGNAVSRGTLPPGTGAPGVDAIERALGRTPTFLLAPARHAEAGAAFFARGFRERFASRDVFADFIGCFDVKGQLAGRHPLDQALYLWSRSVLPNYLLCQLGDRMEMAHGVEARLPFLDHELVELAVRLPATAKIRGGVEKHVLREAVREVVPDSVYRRQKHPFMAPPAAFSPGSPFHELMQDTLRGRSLRDVPFYDAEEIGRLLDLLPGMDEEGRRRVDPLLMTFVSMAKLQESFAIV